MKEKLFIPKKIKVGFQERKDTYTGKLGYVIYYDNLGKLRKESSWQSWRSDDIEPIEVDNDPVEGFVINRGAGGVREQWGWNARQEYVRVYDPREWEFEINIPNLLFILRECNCSKGKGLEGKFVYAWSGTQLVLLPVETEEYRKSIGFTELQGKKITKEDLVLGHTYATSSDERITYLGRMKKHLGEYRSPVGLFHVFVDEAGVYHFHKDIKKIAAVVNGACHPYFAGMVDEYIRSIYGSPVKEVHLIEGDALVDQWGREYHWYRDGSAYECYYFDSLDRCYFARRVEGNSVSTVSNRSWRECPDVKRSGKILVAVLESGSVYKVQPSWGEFIYGQDISQEFCKRKNARVNARGQEASC